MSWNDKLSSDMARMIQKSGEIGQNQRTFYNRIVQKAYRELCRRGFSDELDAVLAGTRVKHHRKIK